MKDKLVAFIRNTLPFAGTKAEEIATSFEEKHIDKNGFLLKEGKICNDYFFLEEGCMRAYALDVDGNEVTTGFYSGDQIVFEAASYFMRVPSRENIQALTDCKGLYMTFDQLQVLFHSVPEFREFGRAVIVNCYVGLKQRMLSMINETAEERYANLLSSRSEIIMHAPLKHIASYLGITDTSLSRIRKEFAHR
ncbi:MAG: Crp/Fnr family transcriptional regulator [Flavipsychrobacter sp.]|nr:Crp/Fnr family transcriptional regulator [Flavipsychrobacter sp.]